jgi:hypothetical protein
MSGPSDRPQPSRPDETVATRGGARRSERHIVLLAALALVCGLGWFLIARSHPAPETVAAPPPAPPAAMAAPRLAEIAALPAAAEIAASRPEVEAGLASGERPSLLTGLHAAVLAWGEVLGDRDRERPAIPQRIGGEDLAHQAVEPGQAVAITGRLDEMAEAPVEGREAGYRWLSLALDGHQYAAVLAPAGPPDLVLNADVAALGRYLGRVDLPTAAGIQAVPLVMARGIEAVVASDASMRPGYLAEFQGSVRLPDDLYADVDDERPLVETRPYYFTIGQVKTELDSPELWAHALDANANANEFHQKPADFRGRPCVLRGIVYNVWEDGEVAADHPFDVRRVTRVMLYKRDTGPVSEEGRTVTRAVLRLYELALVGDGPAPKRGEYIEAQGRFLKWRAIPVQEHPELDALRGVHRQSGNVYTMFFVAAGWHGADAPGIDWMPVKALLSVCAGVCFVLIIIWLKRDRGVERRLSAEVVRLRQGRRPPGAKPAGEPSAPSAAGAPPGGATPPPADGAAPGA